MKKLLCVLISAMLIFTGCGSEDTAVNSVKIYVDSSLETALRAAIDSYTEENPMNVEITSGSTYSLYNKINNDADCDIFIPSSKEQVNSLIKNGYADEENVTPILKNDVVVVKKAGSTTAVKSFDTVTDAKSIAIANENEPIGIFTREIFINLNVFKNVLKMNTSTYDDSPSVAAAVANGKSEIGVCFETDAAADAANLQIIASAPKSSLNSEALYSVTIINPQDGSEPSANTEEIAEYLDSPEAAQIFASYDFEIYIS